MQNLGLNEIREIFLDFFEKKQHLRLASFPLVPKDDKSLLLINAGMAPLKPYFTGQKIPPSNRITTCQKCIRTGDIENVGKTSRHGTFFEMLGNFSFGDYFKDEIISWAWEFVTETLAIDTKRLYVTIYLDDDEAYNIWVNKTSIDPTRIFRLGKEDNFWEIGQGPCGPCSEIHYDRGEGLINSAEEFIKAGNEDRVVEFWNLVFTQFDKDEKGVYTKLKNPNIDTGMGLERISTIMQGTKSIFEIDTIKAILDAACKAAGVKYGENEEQDISLRIITDHIRSVVFMLCDGVLPSNERRGYVLRRLLRRAARHAKLLGIHKIFLYELCDIVIENSKNAYPELEEKELYIKKIIKLEEERFIETIDSGMEILMNYVKELNSEVKTVLEGSNAFKLYDTFGFPVELTEEILSEMNITIDLDGFHSEMKLQRDRARLARGESNYMGSEDNTTNNISTSINTIFQGYDKLISSSNTVLLLKENEICSSLREGEEGIALFETTPFYAEMGGQIGDIGIVYNSKFKGDVINCKKNLSGKILHFVRINEGNLSLGDEVTLEVDAVRRSSINKNHSATHLLHKALKNILGDHVQQLGSFVDNDKLRFDFAHFSSLDAFELSSVENMVNENVMRVLETKTKVMTLQEAKESGAMALFDDKYTNEVRVVSIGDFSKELCGGTHIANSGEIGLFKIISESGVAAGTRRIEAVTGFNALKYVHEKNNILQDMTIILKCTQKELMGKIQNIIIESRDKEKVIADFKSKLAKNIENELIKQIHVIKGISCITAVVKDMDAEALLVLGDKLKNKLGEGLLVLGSVSSDKISFVAMATKEAISRGIHCGKIIKAVAAVAGGGGGGRPDMAQAGGKYSDKVEEAINIVDKTLVDLVK